MFFAEMWIYNQHLSSKMQAWDSHLATMDLRSASGFKNARLRSAFYLWNVDVIYILTCRRTSWQVNDISYKNANETIHVLVKLLGTITSLFDLQKLDSRMVQQ